MLGTYKDLYQSDLSRYEKVPRYQKGCINILENLNLVIILS